MTVTVTKLRATSALTLLLLAVPAAGQAGQQPVIVTPPVGDFTLPPSGQTPAPRPTPSPAVTPTPAPPSPVATPTPAPRPAATRAAARPSPTPTPTPAASPSATPSAQPSPLATPLPTRSPAAVESDLTTNIAQAAEPAGEGLPGWLLAVLGGGLLLAAGLGAGWVLGRRRAYRDQVDEAEAPPAPAAPPPPPPTPSPPARVAPPPPPAAPAVPPPDSALVAELRPLRAAIRDGQVILDFELFVQNRGTESADNIRTVMALMGANAQQDDQLAQFFGAARMAPGSEPFSIAPGGVFMLNGQVALPDDAMPAVQVQGKPMFVPIVPVALRWYAGLSIRTLRDAFMVGTVPAPGNDKLGPLWVDRAATGFGPLAAKRYAVKAGN